MRISKILYKIILIAMLVFMCSTCTCYADEMVDTGGGDVPGSTSDGLPHLGNYKPSLNVDTDTTQLISKILSVFIVIGVVFLVVGLAGIGFGSILGSANQKAVNQEKFVGIAIAAVMITAGSTIAKFIMSFAANI